MNVTNKDSLTDKAQDDLEKDSPALSKKADSAQENAAHDHEHEGCYCGHHHEDEHEHEGCCCGHHHEDEHEHEGCCCGHHHEHADEHKECGCGHHHEDEHEHEGCCCGHHHEHGDEHKECGCGHHHEGHDHSHVENSMDTEWDISELDPKQYRTLFSTLGAIEGIKDVVLNPDGLQIIHRPDVLNVIKETFKAKGLKLKQKVASGKETSNIRIAQMDCPTEEGLIRKKLKGIQGVTGLQFNLMNRVLTVSYNPGDLPKIVEAIKSLDYDAEPLEAQERPKLAEFSPTKISWAKYILGVIIAAGSEAAHFMQLPEWVSLGLAVAAIALVGLGTFKKGFIAFKNLNFNMNALMAVAVTGAVLIGSWPEAAMVMVLFELSEAIEQLSLDKARGAIRSLLALTPQTANVKQADGQYKEIAAKEVKIGDELRVMPGERLAVDGVILEGSSSLDQSAITGESMPVEKTVGEAVFAGSVNKNNEFIYKATSDTEDSMPARIISAIESAQSSRAPTQRFVDSFARVYTPTVFVIALLVALVPPVFMQQPWFEWIYKALTLLVIACPCALVISTPVTIVAGLAAAARKGILVKGGVYLEKGRTLKAIALDKTGTLTEGRPAVLLEELYSKNTDGACALRLAASLAARNNHPVSLALTNFAKEKLVSDTELKEVHGFYAVPGQGVIGSIDDKEYYLGNLKGLDRYYLQNQAIRDKYNEISEAGYSPLIFASEKEVIAFYGVADAVRASSKEAIKQLTELGVKTVMLTGDNAKTANKVGKEVGVSQVKGNLLPEEKQSLVDQLAKKDPVGMVGDGINDGPALARADIGFAMGAAGTDTAIETADVALMDDDLRKLPSFIRLSQKTFTILCQNIFIALSIKLVFFVLTLMGIGTMWMAVFADTGTCLIVVANGLRLLGWKDK